MLISSLGDLHAGTVTFLFTDVEGSTRLVKQLGDRYPDVLARHQELLREAFARHDGREIDTQGDSFFVAFPRARAAVSAAVAAQRALAAEEWPDGAEVRVRMGLHSGDPLVRSDSGGYTGIGVHKAARISAAGYGGQVLVSSATRELIRDDLPPGVQLRNLGEVRLKDIDEPERVYQLTIDGLASEFPRLKVAEPPLYRRRGVLAGAAVGVAAIVAVALLVAGGGGSETTTVRPNSLAAIDPSSNKVVGQTSVGTLPGPITSAAGSLWVGNIEDKTVTRIDPKKLSVVRSIPLKEQPDDLATVAGSPWVAGHLPGAPSVSVRRIDPQFNSLGDPTRVGNVVPGGSASAVAAGGQFWIAPDNGLLTGLDPATGRILKSVDAKTSAFGMGIGEGAVWIAGGDADTVTRVDPSGLVTPISVGHRPIAVAVGGGSVWAVDQLDDSVVRIDPETNAVKSTIAVGHGPGDVAYGAGGVWVANTGSGSVTRIDPRSGNVVKTITVGGAPNGVAVADGRVWVTVGVPIQAPSTTPARGTLRMVVRQGIGVLDPAVAFSLVPWQLEDATCVKLLNYPDEPGARGSQLRPEAAKSLPLVSDHGRTYTFTVRPGYRFSPPSNQPVTADVFRYSIERALDSRLKGAAPQFLSDVVGVGDFVAGKARHVAGISVSGDKLTIRLKAPAPDLPVRLTLPFFCAVPIGTPIQAGGVDPIPMAGPYYPKTSGTADVLVLARNPNYSGPRPHGVQRIELTFNVGAKQQAAMIAKGAADYSIDGVGPGTFPSIKARYGHGAPGKPRLLADPQPAIQYIELNQTRPLFKDERLRRAVNFAIDRTALAQLGTVPAPLAGVPTDQMLPPGVPGYRDVKIYPDHPDLAKARKLAGAGQHRTAVLYLCNEDPCGQLGQLLKTQLAQIGLSVDIHSFSFNQLFARLSRKNEPYDMAVNGWLADYPDPDDFLNLLLVTGAGGSIEPPFSDPRFDGRLAAAARLSGPSRYLAYQKLDADIMRTAAPWAPFANQLSYDFVSARVGCTIYQPLYGLDLAALCLKKTG